MNRVNHILLVVLPTIAIGWPGGVVAGTKQQQAVNIIVSAANEHKPAPVISTRWRLTEAEAYRIQAAVVKRRFADAMPDGFKAGLTSTAAQEKFAVTSAVAGVLPPDSVRTISTMDTVVERDRFLVPMMEAELGFRLTRAVAEPVTSIKVLKTLVAEVLPVVELPDLGFSDRQAVTGVDIVANNVLARQCLVAAAGKAPAAMDINGVEVTVRRGGEIILTGPASDAMGDQWQALLWLVNHMVTQGYTITPDQLLITGAIGRMLPLQAGSYQLDFGELGQLSFTAR